MRIEDAAIVDEDGRIVFFSGERFQRDIVDGDACFMCGARRGVVPFNDEHVIPDWVLRSAKLHKRLIVLPNDASLRYGEYKVPCCVSCNSELGRQVESRISSAFSRGIRGVAEMLDQNGPWLLFQWICLIYLKTHLKDRSLRFHLDRRLGDDPLSSVHDWSMLHHVHCVARSVYTNAILQNEVLGSLFVFQVKESAEPFDYADLPFGALMFRLRDVGIVAVIDDAGAAFSLESTALLPVIEGPVSPLQLREVLSRVAYINKRLRTRPVFYSGVDAGTYVIGAKRPRQLTLKKMYAGGRGRIMHTLLRDFYKTLPVERRSEIERHVKRGEWTFLFTPTGEFNADSF